MYFDVAPAFFLLGVLAALLRTELRFPPSLYQSLTLFLLLAIGLKGGVALAAHGDSGVLVEALLVVLLGIALPVIAFPLLRRMGHLDRNDAASIAAHYGSVSVGTYAVAVAMLEALNISYEAYFPLFVVLLEMPAIVVGLALARSGERSADYDSRKIWHEIFCNQGIVLMAGSLLIGYLAGPRADAVMPFFGQLFHGVLALFLLQLGVVAASRLADLRLAAPFITAFAVLMPLIGATLGAVLGSILDFSTGGTVLLAVLGASSSYIAVPAVMQSALPQANHGLSIAASLGVTFPFNVLVGIPLYIALVTHFRSLS
ncbi:MAG: sodium-dependent bicarbonate transport family permease [Halieaceae bacterium]|nr:sodium-dependent bicarbonate transport family permease [Halieaceae bacterium]